MVAKPYPHHRGDKYSGPAGPDWILYILEALSAPSLTQRIRKTLDKSEHMCYFIPTPQVPLYSNGLFPRTFKTSYPEAKAYSPYLSSPIRVDQSGLVDPFPFCSPSFFQEPNPP